MTKHLNDKDHQTATSRKAGIILSLFGGIPRGLRRGLFIMLARLFYHLAPRHRLIALHNLKLAFPEKDMAELVHTAWGVYRNMALVAAEFFDIPSLTPERLEKVIEVEGMEHYEAALKKKKGLLMFGAHFGNWELGAAAAALLLKPVMIIYRPLDNGVLDALVNGVRSSTGNVPLPKERAMRPMLRYLKDNGIIGLLIDQNVDWYEGVFVDFFGRPACTTDGLALLALHTEAPVMPTFLVRVGGGRYRLVIGEEVQIVRTGDHQADVQANTQIFTKIIEDMVRRYPDQWLWVHQRWKTQIDRSRRDKQPS
jgi:KDO2-lipid IV(A) lauroyltransferase